MFSKRFFVINPGHERVKPSDLKEVKEMKWLSLSSMVNNMAKNWEDLKGVDSILDSDFKTSLTSEHELYNLLVYC